MIMKLNITKINEEEAYQYAELKMQIWNSCYKHLLPDKYLNNISVEHKAANCKNEILTDHAIAYYFIIISGSPVGVLRLKYYDNASKEKCVCIKDLYFLPQYQYKGYGGMAFEFVKKEAIKNNCRFITAYIIETNQSVRSQIKKLGFKETSNKQVHDKTATSSIEYCLDLHDEPVKVFL